MIRRIIRIDEEKCNGCGACATACHEGAIDMVNGKAKLMRENYCDGLGDCLPACPTGAISFEEREAPAYDEAAVLAAQKAKKAASAGCPGSQARTLGGCPGSAAKTIATGVTRIADEPSIPSALSQWPVQIKLAPIEAPYFDSANLLIAADCTAYAYANFHRDFISGKITLIGCPKLDEGDYAEKLTAILAHNNIKSVTVARMQVPCCGGLENAVVRALQACGKMIPWQVVTISLDGRILD